MLTSSLFQEGAQFISFKVVDRGQFQEEKLIQALNDPGKIEGEKVKEREKLSHQANGWENNILSIPGCSGTRNLSDNISDLKAQIASNNKGIKLVSDLIDEYSLEVVQAYMSHIQNTAEYSVREMLKKVSF